MRQKKSCPQQARVRACAKRAAKAWGLGKEVSIDGEHWIQADPAQVQRRKREGWKAHRAAEAAWAGLPGGPLWGQARQRESLAQGAARKMGFHAHDAACGQGKA